jgi:hypothetical protein
MDTWHGLSVDMLEYTLVPANPLSTRDLVSGYLLLLLE